MATQTADRAVSLRTAADFKRWERLFTAKVENQNLEEEIFKGKALLAKPTMPRKPPFPERPTPNTLPSSAGAQTDWEDEDSTPEPFQDATYERRLREYEVDLKEWQAKMLAFNGDRRECRLQETKYRRQRQAVIQVKAWIGKTVNESYLNGCCKPDETVDVWYANIKRRARRELARLEDDLWWAFDGLLEIRDRAPNWVNWINKVESTLARMEAIDMTEVSSSQIWFRKLCRKLQCHQENCLWISTFRMKHKAAIDEGTLDFREVASLLTFKSPPQKFNPNKLLI